jgi:hypothetical protein
MTIQLLMIVSNGEDTILNCLKSYEQAVDRYFICINNSSDQTRYIVKEFKKSCAVPVVIKFIDFDGFANTRNKALELSYDLRYTWTLFVDDSYNLSDNFMSSLTKLDTLNVHCGSVIIRRNTMVYNSNRIVRTASKLKFTGTIHEVINRDSDFSTKILLEDIGTERQLQRTAERVNYDLICLGDLQDARSMYFRAGCYVQLYMRGECDISVPIEHYKKRIACATTDAEETFLSYFHLGHLMTVSKCVKEAVYNYLKAALLFPNRAGEAYLAVYLLTGNNHFITKAYEHRTLGPCRLAADKELYSDDGIISQEYAKVFNGNKLDSIL